MNETFYTLALSMAKGIGHTLAKSLIAYCGSAEEVFRDKKKLIEKINGFGKNRLANLSEKQLFEKAEAELKWLEKEGIRASLFTSDEYPNRLKQCEDGPIILYLKGEMELNVPRVISVVGSRNATILGKKICEEIIQGLSEYDPLIVSGLAYGIDVQAHKAAYNNHLQTVAVLGSGLNNLYPPKHHNIASKIQLNGGLISDYHRHSKFVPSNFAERNRIVAGMADATLVIESALKGGSMITAELAEGYHRDVLAVPGRPRDELSAGCNYLIRNSRAALITSAEDVIYHLGWEQEKPSGRKKQISLFQDLDEDEGKIVAFLEGKSKSQIDEISIGAGLPMSKTSSLLLGLEFKGLILSLPGKMYALS